MVGWLRRAGLLGNVVAAPGVVILRQPGELPLIWLGPGVLVVMVVVGFLWEPARGYGLFVGLFMSALSFVLLYLRQRAGLYVSDHSVDWVQAPKRQTMCDAQRVKALRLAKVGTIWINNRQLQFLDGGGTVIARLNSEFQAPRYGQSKWTPHELADFAGHLGWQFDVDDSDAQLTKTSGSQTESDSPG